MIIASIQLTGSRPDRAFTIIQLPSGACYGTTLESVAEARRRLEARDWLVQVIGNVVRMVREVSSMRGIRA